MARVPQVTRTIQTTRVNVLCLDIEHGEPFNKEVILPRTYKDEKHMMKHVEPLVNTDTVKAVPVSYTHLKPVSRTDFNCSISSGVYLLV